MIKKKKLQPNEEFVGFYEIPNTNAETIATVIKDVLFRIGLPLRSCRGQCYDGAGPMAGIKNGLGVIIQREVPTAHLTHCHGHALSLAVHDTTKGSKILSDAMDTSREVCKLIKFSPKRQAFFERIKDDMKIDAPGIKVLCPTRWTVRAESFNRIIENYDALVKLWDECLDTKLDTEMRARITGVKAQMLDFNYFFLSEPWREIVFNDRQSITNTPTNQNVCRSRSTIGGIDKADNREDENR